MAMSIVSMFEGELHLLIDEQGLGFNFQTSDQLAAGLFRLFSEQGVLDKQSKAATTLFHQRYNSENLMNRYCEIVLGTI